MYTNNIKLLKMIISKHHPNTNNIIISICGNSMYPILCDGDKIKVKLNNTEQYSVGDIIVFPYKKEGLIIHRILKIKDGRYFCKGDNSFRLEDIPVDQVLGIAEVPNDWHNFEEFIEKSLLIARLYRETGYKSSTITNTAEYREYKRKYLIK